MSTLKFSLICVLVFIATFTISGGAKSLGALLAMQSETHTVPVHYVRSNDYQIDIHNDTTWVYDGDRLVGKVVDTNWNSPLHQLIAEDNQ